MLSEAVIINRINFNKLYYFFIVGKEGSIKSASDKLHLSQPSISIQIKSLEDEVGFELFTREHRKLVITEKGKVLLDKAEELFVLADNIASSLPTLGNHQREKFKIGTLQTLSSIFINDFSIDLWDDQLLSTTIVQGCIQDLRYGLDNSIFDFVLSDIAFTNEEKYTSIQLGWDRLIAVAGKGFSLADGNFPHSLSGQPYLSFLNEGATQTNLNHFFLRNGIVPKIVGHLDNAGVMKAVIERGDCFCILPAHAAEDSITNNTILELGEISEVQFNLWGIFPTFSAHKAIIKKVIHNYLSEFNNALSSKVVREKI